MQATLETFGKVHRSKDGKRWHPCQDPLVLCSHTDSAGVWKPHLSGMAGNLCAHSLAVGWAVGSLPTAELLWVSQPCLRQREESSEGETAAVQAQISAGFPLLPTKFWLLIGECWPCLTGRGGSLEPGRMEVVGSKARLSCWAVGCGCCSLAGLSLEGSPVLSPLPGSGTHTRHTVLQPCKCWLCLQGSARSRQESSPLSCGTVSGATAGSS